MEDNITIDFETFNDVYATLKAYERRLRKDAEKSATERFRQLRNARADRVQKLLDTLADADTYAD